MAKDMIEDDIYIEEEDELNELEVNKLSLKYQFKTSRGRIRFITRVSMFIALSFVFYSFVKLPLPIFPTFLEIKFHNLWIILGSFLTGAINIGILLPFYKSISNILRKMGL